MTDPTAVHSLAHQEASGTRTREAFRRYASEALHALRTRATLLNGSTPVQVDHFRLRAHGQTESVDPVGEPIPAEDSSTTLRMTTAPDETGSLLYTAHLRALLRVSVPHIDGRPQPEAKWESATGLKGTWALPDDQAGADFRFAYPLPDAPRTSGVSAYAAAFLDSLLDCVELLHGDGVVTVTAVTVGGATTTLPGPDPLALPNLGSRHESAGSGVQPLHTVAATEPSIVTLARHWALLDRWLSSPGTLTGFALRDLSEWLVESQCHPSEVYEYLARVCNVACQFCYLFGNPDGLAVARGKKVIAESEMDTRLRYFRPESGRALFKSQWEINEFLVDPKLGPVLRELRARSDRDFYFITNGSPLLPRVIDLLAEVQPVTLIVSTNTVDAPLRMQVMNERRTQTQTALQCLELLAERGIPFGLSFVATPDLPVTKMVEALERIEPLRPAMVRVNLPGFTREHPYQLPFDSARVWQQATREIAALRSRFRTPIVIIPSAYEANELYADPAEPRVTGTVPGSPADLAGFRPGDVITTIGIFGISSRAEIQSIVMALNRPTAIQVRRGDQSLTLTLDPAAPVSYPYTGHLIGKYVVPHGLVVAPSLSRGDARSVEDSIAATGAARPWLVTSPLMEQQARAFIARWLPERAGQLHYTVVGNEYLGGNIQVLDMATVADIGRAIRRDAEELRAWPDLVLIPGTGFNRMGRDITGRHWGDLERAFKIPVRLLDVTTQFLF